MARIPNDPTIHVGLRLYDGTDYDTVVERVAYGGFGVIAFGPNRLSQNEMIAYKTLRRDLLDNSETRREFVRECLLWSGLWSHPNIAKAHAVIEMGDARGLRPFIVLSYAEMGSLRDLLTTVRRTQPEKRLPVKIGLNLAQQIAAGLAYLHTPDPAYLRPEPTVHRDLKPENVLLTKGRAVITDFGLAKAVEASPTALALALAEANEDGGGEMEPLAEAQVTRTAGMRTAAGIALGTRAYMPAEQWLGARDAGPAADLYAFGVMLSELLAGRHALLDLDRPHSQEAWRQAHLNPHARSLRDIEPQIPARVEALYQRCLARDPAARPSAAEALAELQVGARETGVDVYIPPEVALHTPYNEFVHWHQLSIARLSFYLYEEALESSNRALALARPLVTERPDTLPATLNTRANILRGLGGVALERARKARRRDDVAGAQQAEREAVKWDAQAVSAYQESLALRPPETTTEGRQGRAVVWHGLGVLHDERRRYAAAEAAYARALALQPDMADTYYNRAGNLRQWGEAEAQAGERTAAVEHLRQARVHAVTSLALGDPTARGLIERIEATLATVEQAAQS